MPESARPLEPETLLAEVDWARRLARALVGPAHGEDVAQEALRIALERRPALEQGSSLRAWLGGVIANLAGKQRERLRSADFHERRAARDVRIDGGGADIERVELQRRLADAVLALDEPYRSAIVLRYFDDLDPRTIAERQGISYDAARQRISRGVALLRVRLDREHVRNERAWSAIALALVRKDGGAPIALGTGGIVMGLKAKLALCGLIAAIGGVALWRAGLEPDSTSPAASVANAKPEVELDRPDAARVLEDSPPANERALAAAADPLPVTPAALDRDLDLHGIVVDPAGKPVAGAELEVSRNQHSGVTTLDLERMRDRERIANAKSSADGTFAIRLEPGRAYGLAVSARGFAACSIDPCHAGERVRVELERGASLSGRLTLRGTDTPVVDAVVTIPRRPDEAGHDHAPGRRAISDADGRYRFDDVAPGSYWIQVAPLAAGTPLWRKVDVHAGERLEEDIPIDAGHTLRGRITDAATGAPIEGAVVGEGWMFERTVRTDADGEYAFEGFSIEGYYDITVRARGYGSNAATVRQPKGPFPERVDVRLRPARTLTGRVVDASARPVVGAYVAAVAYEWADIGGRSDWISAFTDADGRFRIESLSPDLHHALVVRKDGFATFQRQLPAREIETKSFDVGEVVLARGAVVRGVVVDEAGVPIPRHVVELEGLGAGFHALESRELGAAADTYLKSRTTRADDLGRFSFGDVADGSYELAPVLRNERKSKGLHVDIAVGGGVSNLRLVVPRGFPISGRVVDPDGTGLRAYVEVSSANPRFQSSTRSAGDGTFEVPGLEAGTYDVIVRPEDQWFSGGDEVRHASAMVEGVRGGTSALEISVPIAARLSGRVLDVNGAPIAGAQVAARALDAPGSWSTRANTLGEFSLWIARDAPHELIATNSEPIPREARVPSAKAGNEPIEIRIP